MKLKYPVICALLLAVAASPVGAQTAPAQQPPAPTTTANFDAQAVATESAGAFAGRVADLRQTGDWNQMIAVGRARRAAHPDESVAWHAEALGAYGNGDVAAAIAAWKSAPDLATIPGADELLATAQAVQRNYPGQSFQPAQFVDSDTKIERLRWQNKATDLLKAKDYDAIEATASELQKSGQTDAMKQPFLQSFYEGLALAGSESQPLEQIAKEWRAARPNSILARLVEIDLSTSAAWDARGGGYADSITPAMSQNISDALERGAQVIAELPPAANESPLTFTVLLRWGQLGGDGRPFLDAVYHEGNARFPNYLPIFKSRVIDLLPRWFGAEGELIQSLQAYADQIVGAEGDGAYALGIVTIDNYEKDVPHDDARFWRGLDALRASSPDSTALRTLQLYYGELQGVRDGNYEHIKGALSEPKGYILDNLWYGKPSQRAYFGEYRMKMLANDKPR